MRGFSQVRRKLRSLLFPKDTLLRLTDRRYHGLWIGDAPELLNTGQLREGQILFGAGHSEGGAKIDEKGRKAIAYATSGPYVHCGMLLEIAGQLVVFEAVRKHGAVATPIPEFAARYRYVSVFRDRALVGRHLEQARAFARLTLMRKPKYAFFSAILSFIREYAHQRHYWSSPVVRPSVLRIARHARSDDTSYFCSSLVLATLRESGISGYDHPYFAEKNWTPMMLAEDSGVLEFRGYVAASYLSISELDPALAGNGWRLAMWEKARLAGDTKALNSFSTVSDDSTDR